MVGSVPGQFLGSTQSRAEFQARGGLRGLVGHGLKFGY